MNIQSKIYQITKYFSFQALMIFFIAVIFLFLTNGIAYANHPPEVALTGTMGTKALVVVNGGAPKVMAPGQEHMGIKLERMQGDKGHFSYRSANGSEKKFEVKIGQAPVKFDGAGASSTGSGDSEIVLTADGRGHFSTTGYVNNKAITFLVDTGATSIALDKRDAMRMGIDFSKAPVTTMQTANGLTQGWVVVLDSVRIQNVEVRNVEATVSSLGPGFALLGNTFLKRFDITQTNNQMILKRRY